MSARLVARGNKKFFRRHPDRIFFLFGLIMLCSEVWKQLTLTFLLGHGTYNLWYFPFQLCSIPMYIFLALPFIRSTKIRRALLDFLMCYALLGGIAVFADTSGLHYSYAPLTVHSYLWHLLMIGTAVFSGIVCAKEQPAENDSFIFSAKSRMPVSLRTFAGSTALYLACCLIAVIINLSLDRFGTINMFYINPDYSMQQIVFRDIAVYIGNLPSIFIYVCATICGAFLLFLLWNVLFRLFYRKSGRKKKSL